MNVSPARRLLGSSSTQVRHQRIPDFLKSEIAKVAFVGRRKMPELERQTADGQTSPACEAACRSLSAPIRKQESVLLHLHAGKRIALHRCGAANKDWRRKEKDWCRQKRSRMAPLLDGVGLRTNRGGINQERYNRWLETASYLDLWR